MYFIKNTCFLILTVSLASIFSCYTIENSSPRDNCKGNEEKGKQSDRDYFCSMARLFNDSKIYDFMLISCIYTQIQLNKCDKKTTLPIGDIK